MKKPTIPTLEDVIAPGKILPTENSLPEVEHAPKQQQSSSQLTDAQLHIIQKTTENMLQTQLQPLLEKTKQEIITEIKAYLNKGFSEILKNTRKPEG